MILTHSALHDLEFSAGTGAVDMRHPGVSHEFSQAVHRARARKKRFGGLVAFLLGVPCDWAQPWRRAWRPPMAC